MEGENEKRRGTMRQMESKNENEKFFDDFSGGKRSSKQISNANKGSYNVEGTPMAGKFTASGRLCMTKLKRSPHDVCVICSATAPVESADAVNRVK
ncbi:unnamed protein product [Dovyalis caffra]|uniref:Uncharacterized protein n=1 Tax=Dovyalis caffra TaxID=77055 RepID=A0AAV1SHQ4_9ROSI|nr:unnamed protein product [Dovyalis caffra]